MSDRPVVSELLRAAAAHRPDRERMLARVEEGRRAGRAAAGARPRRRWVRVAGAAAALVATLGAATLAAGWQADERREAPAASPAERRGHIRAAGEVDPGSNPYWSQSNVTMTVDEPLTSLTVELRVAEGRGVRPTGAWRTLPSGDFELTTAREGGELVFRWTLRRGAEVPPGEHVFAGQYDHDRGPRSAAADSFVIRGDGPGGAVSVRGGFA